VLYCGVQTGVGLTAMGPQGPRMPSMVPLRFYRA
jgi:hypothetical protein